MTDKQIIIDGVDVSGCTLYEDNPKNRMWGTCDCMRSMVDQSGYDELAGAECKGYNCYYKQLKRKERRCDMWENIAVENGAVALKYQQQIDQLKAERDSYIDKYFLESQKVINIKKVLIEIKEIAEMQCVCGVNCQDMKIILQKISEV